jgi:hypothetical protein
VKRRSNHHRQLQFTLRYLQIEGGPLEGMSIFFKQQCKITEDLFSLIEYQPLKHDIIKITNKHLHIKSKYLK